LGAGAFIIGTVINPMPGTATMNALCTEPSLDELLAEGVTRLLMRSDGVNESDIRNLLRRRKDSAGAQPTVAPSRPLAAGARRHASRALWFIGLLVIAFIGVTAARQALQPPGETIRSELTAAAVELARPVGPLPTPAELDAIRRHFASFDTRLDASSWPQVAVTLRHLDWSTCAEARQAAPRIEGLVVIELTGYRSAADCRDDNDMTWRITP
jgi:hypothetical protein